MASNSLASTGGATPYATTPLDPSRKEIRLLHLYPAQRPEDAIEGVLSVASLDDADVSYETISCVWGDPLSRGDTLISGCRLSVPSVAIQVLQQLRFEDRERTLWLDAVCINQADSVERGSQVVMMGQIYSRGQHNLIYLGPGGSSDLSQALRDLNTIHDEMMDETNNMKDIEGTMFDGGDLDDSKYRFTGIRCVTDWVPLERFFDLPWFRRLWVFQEAALSSSTCYVGSATIPFLVVSRVAKWIFHKRAFVPDSVLERPGAAHASDLFSFVDQTHGWYCKAIGRSHPAAELLATFKGLDCSDDRDRVFGMLGVIRWDGREPLLAPDYGKSTFDVLRDATRFALAEVVDLDSVWEWVSYTSQDTLEGKEHLSWVPDWSRRRDPACGPFTLHVSRFMADSRVRCEWKDDSPEPFDADVFERTGFVLDRIAETGPELTNEVWRDITQVERWLEESLALLLQASIDTAASVLVAGAHIAGQRATDRDLAGLLAHYQDWIREEGAFPPLPSDLTDLDDRGAAAFRFDQAFGDASVNRRVFRTAVSEYIGVGPKCTLEGDVVAIFYGCCTPYVLRPYTDGRYRLVGQCYVCGVMGGEATRENERSGWAKDQLFRLI